MEWIGLEETLKLIPPIGRDATHPRASSHLMQKLKDPPCIPLILPESSRPSPCSCSIPWVMPKGITGPRHEAARAAGSIWAVTDAINPMLVKVCSEGDAFPTANKCHSAAETAWAQPLSSALHQGVGLASACAQTGNPSGLPSLQDWGQTGPEKERLSQPSLQGHRQREALSKPCPRRTRSPWGAPG